MIQKQPVNINFGQGLQTKTDPFQISPGQFLNLTNTSFSKTNLMQKRNGYGSLTNIGADCNFLTTYNGNLTAVGTTMNAYSQGSNTWVSKGSFKPVSLNTLSLVRSNTNQSQTDTAVSLNGLVCTVFTDNIPNSMTTTAPTYKYVIADSTTGQNIIAPALIPVTSGAISTPPKVFIVGNYFVIIFNNSANLQYVAISTADPSAVSANTTLSTQSSGIYDGIVSSQVGSLYIAFNGTDGGGAIRATSLSPNLIQGPTRSFPGQSADVISICCDDSTSSIVLYISYYLNPASNFKAIGLNSDLTTKFGPSTGGASAGAENISSAALHVSGAGQCTVIFEMDNPTDLNSGDMLRKYTVSDTGSFSSITDLNRCLGLASKSFIYNGTIYFLATYGHPGGNDYQPTYFFMDSSGNILSRLAYSNGAGLYDGSTGQPPQYLPSFSVINDTAYVSYLIKDLITPINSSSTTSVPGYYSQLGINIASFNLKPSALISSEIAGNLNMSGGFMWNYDGSTPVENGFFLWPDQFTTAISGTAGSIGNGTYYYKATYEWSDNNGNINRSAPSLVQSEVVGGGPKAIDLNIPTLRVTYKIANPVKIVIYRYSVAQPIYYQVTSTAVPLLNDPTVDFVSFTDTLSDASISGNNILYTTGGIVENIGPPGTDNITLYRSRLILVDAEDRNLLWYSKQVIESTPVEMSDLFTIYVAPTTAAQGNTGPITALSAMDDKLIIFKKNAIYYITGNGPDNTGSNNDFSEPVFITSTVGCANQSSIVFMPNGLMFQSDKGIWLLGRDLNTTYIGAPVEAYNNSSVNSSLTVPGTNEVRFTLDSGVTLMFDYFQGQWGTYTGVPAVSSTLYQNLHTYINDDGVVRQETPGIYLDGTRPVQMSFTTGWLNLAGLQGFERAYSFFLLGTYISPHKLQLQIAYDYSSSPTQTTYVYPDNFSGVYGSDPLYGNGNEFGGSLKLEQWQVFLQTQKCEAFQITLNEIYDPSFGVPSGAGFTLSGMELLVGIKGGAPKLRAAWSVG